MKYLRYIAPLVMMGLLSGCGAQQQKAAIQESSPASKALIAAMKKVPKSEFDRCFKNNTRSEHFTMYRVLERQKSGRECAVAVENYPGGVRPPFDRVTPVAGIADGDGYSVEKCEMQILRCVDPVAAKRISGQYGLKN